MPSPACYNCFKILSDKNRAEIVSLLQKGEKRVNDLLENFDIGQPTVSYHLAKLKKYQLVKTRKRGREVFYSLDKKRLCRSCRVFKSLKFE